MKNIPIILSLLLISLTSAALGDVTVTFQPQKGTSSTILPLVDNILKIDQSVTDHTATTTTVNIKITNKTGAWYSLVITPNNNRLVRGIIKPVILGPHWQSTIGPVTFYNGGKLLVYANTDNPVIALELAFDIAYRIALDPKGLPQKLNITDQLLNITGSVTSGKMGSLVSAVKAYREKKSAATAWDLANALYQILEIKPVKALFKKDFKRSLPALSRINLLIGGVSMAVLWAQESKAFFQEEVVQFNAVDNSQPTPDYAPPSIQKYTVPAPVIVIDRSGSLEDATGVMQQIESRAGDVVSAIQNTVGAAAVINFSGSGSAFIDARFTANPSVLLHAIQHPSVNGGNTAIYDAVEAAAQLAQGRHAMLILLTDGEDNQSQHKIADAVRFCKERNIPMVIIGFKGTGGRNEADLINMANSTGGFYVRNENANIENILSRFYQYSKYKSITRPRETAD